MLIFIFIDTYDFAFCVFQNCLFMVRKNGTFFLRGIGNILMVQGLTGLPELGTGRQPGLINQSESRTLWELKRPWCFMPEKLLEE